MYYYETIYSHAERTWNSLYINNKHEPTKINKARFQQLAK